MYIHGKVSSRMDLEITRISFWAGTLAVVFLVPLVLEKAGIFWLSKPLRWIGGVPFEIYIVHRLLQYIYWK